MQIMSQELAERILSHVKSSTYRPAKRRNLARQLNVAGDEDYSYFKAALRDLIESGQLAYGAGNTVGLPKTRRDAKVDTNVMVGTYRQNRRGFGFVTPDNSEQQEDLFIAPGDSADAISGDVVRARVTNKDWRDGKPMWSGKILEVVKRTNKRFVGTLVKERNNWFVHPDGNTITEPILAPDAAGRHIKPGTKVVVDLTVYPVDGERAQGVITEVLGAAGEKDVDLKSVIVQFNLPEAFPHEVLDEARRAVDSFHPKTEAHRRLDLSDETIVTIDPNDAKDYDDAISLKQLDNGYWELGVHIADVSHFVKDGTALDEEARERGNSTYFPGFVIPMLPEVLSNGVCSLQEGVPRLCKSVFITYDDGAHPVGARFANTIIKSAKRLRYVEAQNILDGSPTIHHPDGDRTVRDYPREVVELLFAMNDLAKRLQARRAKQGQLVLDLPEVELILDDEGKVVDAVPEDTSFTHTLIEMFMVEANEAVARLLHSLDVPFLRRVHPEPEAQDHDKLRHFTQVTGYKLPKDMDRHAIQALLKHVREKPEAFAINMAILRSLTRAEYSPQTLGHFALASEHYSHFTSPIRRYADLTIHRLLDAYFDATGSSRDATHRAPRGGRKFKPVLDNIPSYNNLVDLGKHISFTERRSEEAERELRQVKILELLKDKVGDEYVGVITNVTNFGIFVQLKAYLIDGLIKYEDLTPNDFWQVDENSGSVRGRRTGQRISIGDVVRATIVRVDVPRRQLDLAIVDFVKRSGGRQMEQPIEKGKKSKHARKHDKHRHDSMNGRERRGKSRHRR